VHAKSRSAGSDLLAAVERKTDGEKRRANRSGNLTSGVKVMKANPAAGFQVRIYLKCCEVIISASIPLDDAKRLCSKEWTWR
jgi:hypothetical protein